MGQVKSAYPVNLPIPPKVFQSSAFFFLQKDIWGNNLLVFQIEANAFLWKMVRTLTGTLVNLDKNNQSFDSMQKILDSKATL